jgi:antitoxin component of RelBE/YafQ-DinJ toxin-antitoxin module
MNSKTKQSSPTTMLHLRIDKSLHNNVKKVANAMGVSMSLISETLFKQFLEEKSLTLTVNPTPNAELNKILDESEKNRDNSKYWKSHSSVKSLMNGLKK